MNASSLHRTERIIINSTTIVLTAISVCISTGMILFLTYHLFKIKTSPNRVALLVTTNIYFTMLTFSILLLEQTTRSLKGHLYSLESLDDGIYCRISAYLVLAIVCNIYYANTLQAIYRLCRIIFYQNQSLQSFKLYTILIIIQWIFSFIITLPTYLLDDFKYLVDDYYCQILFTYLRSVILSGILVYMIPIIITSGCYIYTLRKIRRKNQTMSAIQKISAQRDLVVLFRICLLLALLMLFVIPSIAITLITYITGVLPWWSAPIQWLSYNMTIACVTVVLAIVSPHIYNLWTKTVAPQQEQQHKSRKTTPSPVINIR